MRVASRTVASRRASRSQHVHSGWYGWVLEWATGINDAGQIIVRARRDLETRAFLLMPRFRDLSPVDPHRDAILALADRDIMRGYSDGRLRSRQITPCAHSLPH